MLATACTHPPTQQPALLPPFLPARFLPTAAWRRKSSIFRSCSARHSSPALRAASAAFFWASSASASSWKGCLRGWGPRMPCVKLAPQPIELPSHISFLRRPPGTRNGTSKPNLKANLVGKLGTRRVDVRGGFKGFFAPNYFLQQLFQLILLESDC